MKPVSTVYFYSASKRRSRGVYWSIFTPPRTPDANRKLLKLWQLTDIQIGQFSQLAKFVQTWDAVDSQPKASCRRVVNEPDASRKCSAVLAGDRQQARTLG
jgi:hypothetical protein